MSTHAILRVVLRRCSRPAALLLATGSQDKSARIWDASTGKELATLTGHPEEVHQVAITADGTTVATLTAQVIEPGKHSPIVKMWDARSSKELATTHTSLGVYISWVEFSPDGKTLAIVETSLTGLPQPQPDRQSIVVIWDFTAGMRRVTDIKHLGNDSHSIRYFPNGGRLVVGANFSPMMGQRIVHVWDLSNCRLVETMRVPSMVWETRYHAIDWQATPEGRQVLATAGELSGLWDLATGEELATFVGQFGHDAPLSVAYSPPSGAWAVGYTDGTIRVWDGTQSLVWKRKR